MRNVFHEALLISHSQRFFIMVDKPIQEKVSDCENIDSSDIGSGSVYWVFGAQDKLDFWSNLMVNFPQVKRSRAY